MHVVNSNAYSYSCQTRISVYSNNRTLLGNYCLSEFTLDLVKRARLFRQGRLLKKIRLPRALNQQRRLIGRGTLISSFTVIVLGKKRRSFLSKLLNLFENIQNVTKSAYDMYFKEAVLKYVSRVHEVNITYAKTCKIANI